MISNYTEKQTADAFATAIEAAFNSAGSYTKFEGATMTASEGFFIGFKHDDNIGEAILLTRAYTVDANIILFVRNSTLNDGTWSAYKLGKYV